MLMRIARYIAFVALALLASCGGTAERKHDAEGVTAESEELVVNYDSLLRVMDARYNALCEERREALNERDAERRRVLLEANDRACMEFRDSLKWLLQMQR
jgi:hypothetical protein